MEKKVDKYYYKELGYLIHEERLKKGYSLRYLSQQTGLSRTTLDDYELGKKRITMINWNLICNALGIKPKVVVNVAIG